MAAPKGNDFYKRRSKDGRELIFETPEDLLATAYEYFDWCKKTPMYKREVLKGGKEAGKVIKVEVERPYTIEGLCVYAEISVSTFYNYEEREDFLQVITHVREIIRQNQLEGAIVEAYNPNIVARVLSLADKQEHSIKNDLTINVSSEDSKKKLQKLHKNLQIE